MAAPEAGTLHRLTHSGDSTPLVWMEDGQSLLVGRPGHQLSGQQLSELWTVSLYGGEQLLSGNAFYPATYGDQVAYLSFADDAGWTAVRSDLHGDTTIVLGPAQWKMPPTWASGSVAYLDRHEQLSGIRQLSGSQILTAATRLRLAPNGLDLATVIGGSVHVSRNGSSQVVGSGQWAGGLTWSPDGNRLAYVLVGDGMAAQLWTWDAATGAHSLLYEEHLAHLGAPAWSPDGTTLAFAVYPTGSAAGGDLWLAHADGSAAWPLARTPADESAPCWSPDGRRLAFRLDGDVWIADPGARDLEAALLDVALGTPASGLNAYDATDAAAASAPGTILVMHDDYGNSCRDRPHGAIDAYDFESYVQRVVPHEVPASWPTESLKAQAVAARTYAWRKYLDRRAENPYPGFDVWDSTRDQYMCDGTDARTNAAVDATRGVYLSYADKVIYAFFSAEAGSPTNYLQQFPTVPYLRSTDDPVGFGQTRRGHSWGLSQWGAYRWAAWHSWDYVQILTHYYTGATVTPSASGSAPVAAVSLPWSDHYLTADRAYLQASAADDVPITSVAFEMRTDGTWQTICTDATGSDGWSCVWPVSGLPDTDSPSLGLRTSISSTDGGSASSSVSWIGLDRTPPTGTLRISSSTVTTLSVTLAITATDPVPPEGEVRVSFGDDHWVWEDTTLYHWGGDCLVDDGAGDGSAWYLPAGSSGVLYGPYTEQLSAGTPYRALFRIKVLTPTLSLPAELARLDVATDQGSALLGVRYLRGTDFRYGNTYDEFAVDFYAASEALEFRVDASGATDLWVDRVRVVTYPGAVPSEVAWALPAREGRTLVTAKFVDAAGNHSADASLPVWVKDATPPQDWRAFRCTATACTIEVRDIIAGLDVSSASYRVSGDGGLSWDDWLPAVCSGGAASHEWETITSGPLSFSNVPATRLQFRIRDAARLPNESVSPALSVWRVYLPAVLLNAP